MMALRRVGIRSRLGESLADVVEDYAHNFLVNIDARELPMAEIASSTVLFRHMVMKALPQENLFEEDTGSALRAALKKYFQACKNKPRSLRPLKGTLAKNLNALSHALGLEDGSRDVLQFIVALRTSGDLGRMMSVFGDVNAMDAALVSAAAMNVSEDVVIAALHPRGRLVTSGLVSLDERPCFLAAKLQLKTGILDELMLPGLSQDRLLKRFLPEAPVSALDWEDIDYMNAKAHTAGDILAGALSARHCGINLLFYGPTGTGKTAVARLLAQHIGAKLFVAGLSDESGESASPRNRLSSLLLGQRLATNGPALLVFDELEDLFRDAELARYSGRSAPSMSKQWFNDFLENNPVPVIWITNSLRGIDPAFIRRFAYALEFRPLSRALRARALSRQLGADSKLTSADITAVVARHEAGPAQLQTAVSTARLVTKDGKVDRPTLERILAPVEKALTGKDPSRRATFDPARYCIDALNSSTDLSALADTLSREGPREGLSFCLYGPPGTGKTEYIRYLAHRMGRPVIHRRASDLLDKYVGESEKRIAEAFARAEEEQAVLLFDEVDSFLRDRTTAVRSWEVTQVNELLQQLESFRGVFACTTNLWHDIDQAALRRFVFKIEMKFLRTDQALMLFESLFDKSALTSADLDEARHTLSPVNNLTPGDFAVVSRRQRALRSTLEPHAVLEELLAEARAKKGSARAIGFDRNITMRHIPSTASGTVLNNDTALPRP